LYLNQGKNFFCEGTVSLNHHRLEVRHGELEQIDDNENPNHYIEMTDACTLTRALKKGTVQEKQVTCQDKTQAERTATTALKYAWNGIQGLFGITSTIGIAKWVKKKTVGQKIIQLGKIIANFSLKKLDIFAQAFPRLFWFAKKLIPGSAIVWVGDKIYAKVS